MGAGSAGGGRARHRRRYGAACTPPRTGPLFPHSLDRCRRSPSVGHRGQPARTRALGRLPYDAQSHLRGGSSGAPAHYRSSPMDEETFNAYMAQWRGPEGQEAYLRKVERFDEQHTKEFEPLLGSIGVPVRIIWGEEDAWLAPAFARELQELMPGSELYLIAGAGHFSIEDQPDAVAGELANFFG